MTTLHRLDNSFFFLFEVKYSLTKSMCLTVIVLLKHAIVNDTYFCAKCPIPSISSIHVCCVKHLWGFSLSLLEILTDQSVSFFWLHSDHMIKDRYHAPCVSVLSKRAHLYCVAKLRVGVFVYKH